MWLYTRCCIKNSLHTLFVWIEWYSVYCVVFAISCHAHLHPPCRPTCLTHVLSMQKTLHYRETSPWLYRCFIYYVNDSVWYFRNSIWNAPSSPLRSGDLVYQDVTSQPGITDFSSRAIHIIIVVIWLYGIFILLIVVDKIKEVGTCCFLCLLKELLPGKLLLSWWKELYCGFWLVPNLYRESWTGDRHTWVARQILWCWPTYWIMKSGWG